MPKSGGAVIPMPLNFNDLQFVIGSADRAAAMSLLKPLPPFADEVIEFLNALSKELMKKSRGFSDVATFAFWCRKPALLQEKKSYDDLASRLGRGVIFHSTPSNVAVNFAFSFAAGLLAGNANIVRLPGKEFAQVDMICAVINELLQQDFQNLAPYVCMVKYPPHKEISDAFSALCNGRVVWGGDETIARMRLSPLPPRAVEITFADRHSLLVINAEAYLQADNKERLAQDFYNDTYLSDQNACTSPRIIIWLGNKTETAREIFWQKLHLLLKDKYNLAPVQAVGKLSAFYKAAAEKPLRLCASPDNLIMRLELERLDEDLMDYKYNSGFFFEYQAENLAEILPLASVKCQTLTYFGLEKEQLAEFFKTVRPHGIDRAVPMGKSMDFTLVWDGYDLIRELSRKISIL